MDRLRIVGPDDLVAFAEAAGLVVEELAGDYDLGPLEAGAERVVLVAQAPLTTRLGWVAERPAITRAVPGDGTIGAGKGPLPCVVESARCRIS